MFTREKGGILFIIHKSLKNNNRQAVARDDVRQSAVCDFNIGVGSGVSILFECEKALSDQSMSIDFIDKEGYVIWFGGSLDESGEKYLQSSYGDGSHSAPATQTELVNRVNQTIDLCFKYMTESVEQDKRVYANASNRMNGYLSNTKLGVYAREKYPEIFQKVK